MRKDEIRHKLLDYLANPENEWLPRSKLAVNVLGYSAATGMYQRLVPADLDEIEKEALKLRLQRMGRQVCNVMTTLYNKGIKGDVSACKEFLNRTLGDRSLQDFTDADYIEEIKVIIVKPRAELQVEKKVYQPVIDIPYQIQQEPAAITAEKPEKSPDARTTENQQLKENEMPNAHSVDTNKLT